MSIANAEKTRRENMTDGTKGPENAEAKPTDSAKRREGEAGWRGQYKSLYQEKAAVTPKVNVGEGQGKFRTAFDWETPEGQAKIEEAKARRQEYSPEEQSDYWRKPIEEQKAISKEFLKGNFNREDLSKAERKKVFEQMSEELEDKSLTPEQRKEKAWEEEKARLKALKKKSEEFLKGEFTRNAPDIDRKKATAEAKAKLYPKTAEQIADEAADKERAAGKAKTAKPVVAPAQEAPVPVQQPVVPSAPEQGQPSQETKEAKSGLTQEAMDLLETLDKGGIPAFITSNVERILIENRFDQKDINGKTLDELTDMLRAKRIEAAAVPAPDVEVRIPPKVVVSDAGQKPQSRAAEEPVGFRADGQPVAAEEEVPEESAVPAEKSLKDMSLEELREYEDKILAGLPAEEQKALRDQAVRETEREKRGMSNKARVKLSREELVRMDIENIGKLLAEKNKPPAVADSGLVTDEAADLLKATGAPASASTAKVEQPAAKDSSTKTKKPHPLSRLVRGVGKGVHEIIYGPELTPATPEAKFDIVIPAEKTPEDVEWQQLDERAEKLFNTWPEKAQGRVILKVEKETRKQVKKMPKEDRVKFGGDSLEFNRLYIENLQKASDEFNSAKKEKKSSLSETKKPRPFSRLVRGVGKGVHEIIYGPPLEQPAVPGETLVPAPAPELTPVKTVPKGPVPGGQSIAVEDSGLVTDEAADLLKTTKVPAAAETGQDTDAQVEIARILERDPNAQPPTQPPAESLGVAAPAGGTAEPAAAAKEPVGFQAEGQPVAADGEKKEPTPEDLVAAFYEIADKVPAERRDAFIKEAQGMTAKEEEAMTPEERANYVSGRGSLVKDAENAKKLFEQQQAALAAEQTSVPITPIGIPEPVTPVVAEQPVEVQTGGQPEEARIKEPARELTAEQAQAAFTEAHQAWLAGLGDKNEETFRNTEEGQKLWQAREQAAQATLLKGPVYGFGSAAQPAKPAAPPTVAEGSAEVSAGGQPPVVEAGVSAESVKPLDQRVRESVEEAKTTRSKEMQEKLGVLDNEVAGNKTLTPEQKQTLQKMLIDARWGQFSSRPVISEQAPVPPAPEPTGPAVGEAPGATEGQQVDATVSAGQTGGQPPVVEAPPQGEALEAVAPTDRTAEPVAVAEQPVGVQAGGQPEEARIKEPARELTAEQAQAAFTEAHQAWLAGLGDKNEETFKSTKEGQGLWQARKQAAQVTLLKGPVSGFGSAAQPAKPAAPPTAAEQPAEVSASEQPAVAETETPAEQPSVPASGEKPSLFQRAREGVGKLVRRKPASAKENFESAVSGSPEEAEPEAKVEVLPIPGEENPHERSVKLSIDGEETGIVWRQFKKYDKKGTLRKGEFLLKTVTDTGGDLNLPNGTRLEILANNRGSIHITGGKGTRLSIYELRELAKVPEVKILLLARDSESWRDNDYFYEKELGKAIFKDLENFSDDPVRNLSVEEALSRLKKSLGQASEVSEAPKAPEPAVPAAEPAGEIKSPSDRESAIQTIADETVRGMSLQEILDARRQAISTPNLSEEVKARHQAVINLAEERITGKITQEPEPSAQEQSSAVSPAAPEDALKIATPELLDEMINGLTPEKKQEYEQEAVEIATKAIADNKTPEEQAVILLEHQRRFLAQKRDAEK